MAFDWHQHLLDYLKGLGEDGISADMRTIVTFDQEPAIVVISTSVGVGFNQQFEEWWAWRVHEQTKLNKQAYEASRIIS